METPTGRIAVVIETHAGGEVTVEWEDGNQARFRAKLLKAADPECGL